MSNINNHDQKPISDKAKRFIKRVFPSKYFVRLNKSFGLDVNKEKLFFRSFALFIIIAVIIQPQDTSLRDLSSFSKEEGTQTITGIKPISHTLIGKRLNSIPPDCMDKLLHQLSTQLKGRLQYKNIFPKGMKVFDVTTFSVSANHYEWVATRQSRGNLRFLFVMDSNSGTPDAIVDVSANLNDNTAFQTALQSAKQGRYFVFDKGFNNFKILKQLTESKQHFITRFKSNYIFKRTTKRKLPASVELDGDRVIESDDIGTIGQKSNNNEIEVRRITCLNMENGKTFIVITDDRNLSAKTIVKMYAYRWPIEVLFRHIKSNLHIVHFPSRDQVVVYNWFVFIALSVICIQLLTFESGTHNSKNLMMRKTPFKEMLRIARSLIRSWIVYLTIELRL